MTFFSRPSIGTNAICWRASSSAARWPQERSRQCWGVPPNVVATSRPNRGSVGCSWRTKNHPGWPPCRGVVGAAHLLLGQEEAEHRDVRRLGRAEHRILLLHAELPSLSVSADQTRLDGVDDRARIAPEQIAADQQDHVAFGAAAAGVVAEVAVVGPCRDRRDVRSASPAPPASTAATRPRTSQNWRKYVPRWSVGYPRHSSSRLIS